jgi:hypothetical protein
MTDQPNLHTTPPAKGEVIPESQAKQGNRGFHMLGVLVISIALLAVIYLGIYFTHARPTADSGHDNAAQRTAAATKTAS